MDTIVRKVLGAIAGVAICIAIWTIQGRLGGGSEGETAESIPSEVFGGGGGVVTIEVQASEPAIVSASFEANLDGDEEDHRYLDTWQQIPAGTHTFDIDVPADVSGSVGVRVEKPSVGAKLKLVVRTNGKVVGEDFVRLEEPLQAGYGFYAGLEIEDYVSGRLLDEAFFD